MKYIVSLAAVVLGYAVCSPTVRELVVNQPDWAWVIEGIIAYVVCGFPAFLHSASKYVRSGDQRKPDSSDIGDGIFAWIVWPAYTVWKVVAYVWEEVVSPTGTSVGSKLARAATAYGNKRKTQ